MFQRSKLAASLLGFVAIWFSQDAHAERKVLYVHGKIDKFCYNGTVDRCYQDGNYDARYWGGVVGPTSRSSAFYVGYNGTSDPREWGAYVNGLRLSDGVYTGDGPAWNRAQTQIHAALWWGNEPTYGGAACNDGNNWCVMACHSAGCYALDYYFAHFDPNWETLWGRLNAYHIYAVSSATGGSELADSRWSLGSNALSATASAFGIDPNSTWAGDQRSWPMTAALETSQARSFNHHATMGRATYHSAGHDSGPEGWITDNYFGVKNDGAVAFHSQCGYESKIDTNLCLDAGGWCARWSSCPWYNPFCTRYCRDFRTYNHWTGHYVLEHGNVYGASEFSTTSHSYDKTHSQMRSVLMPVLEYFSE